MKLRALAPLALVVPALFAIGCKSEYEKFADESCACKDAACVKEVGEKHKGLFGNEKATMKEIDAKLAALPEKDKKAFERGFKCAMEISFKEAKEK